MVAGIPGQELLEVKIASADGKAFHCLGNVPVEPHAAIDDLDKADVVIVCDMYTSISDVPTGRYPREVAWLKRLHRRSEEHTSELQSLMRSSYAVLWLNTTIKHR